MSREMIDSNAGWIGSIPSEWSAYKLLYALERPIFDGPHETPTVVDNGIPFISVDSVNDTKNVDLNVCKKFISEEDFNEYYKKTPLKQGDVLFTKAATIGKTAIVDDRKYMVWSPLAILRSGEHVNNEYLYYVLNCPNLIDYTAHFLGNSATQINVGMRELERAKLPVPPLSEQRQIVHFLDRKCSAIDTAIEKTKESIEKLEEYKKAVITKAVTKGLDPDAKMKDSGVEWIGEVPEGWEIRPLKFTSDSISKGNGITKDDVVEDGDMQCVRYGEIYFQYDLSFSQCKSKTRLNKVSSPQFFSYGDILCAGTGELIDEIGKPIVYLGDQNCLAGGDIVIVKHKQNPRFLEYALSSSYAQAQRSLGKYKLKVVHISAGEIGSVKIALPNITEQNRIADYLDNKIADITKVIDNKLAVISKWEEYKKSLIYYAVTGKIDCRNEVL